MAVYTPITEEALKAALSLFDLGDLSSFEGITEGVENTNYKVVTTKAAFVLTVFEKRVNAEELPFYISLMEHMRKKGVPSPHVAEMKDGRHIFSIKGKPAILTSFLAGAWPKDVSLEHCIMMGGTVGKMHIAGKTFPMQRRNAMNLSAWRNLIHTCRDTADSVEKGLFAQLEKELAFQAAHWPKTLPRGAVHADLFPDNVFFLKDSLSGVIDFYFACTEIFAYDLMLTLNPWCFSKEGVLDPRKSSALLTHYNAERKLHKDEIAALPFFGRAAALRIIATRLYDKLNPAQGALVKAKDPMEHVRILRFHQNVQSAADYGFPL